MKSPSRLYNTMIMLLAPAPSRDRRHLSTLAWRVVGLLSSGWIAFSGWVLGTVARRWTRTRGGGFSAGWRIGGCRGHPLYGALLAELEGGRLTVVLDTSLLWNGLCLIRLRLVYRGRTVPLVWKVIRHRSSRVPFRDYRGLWR